MKKLRLSNRARRAFRGGSGGMTLIEVLLALFIIGVVAVVFLSGLIVAARSVLIADVRTTAESLARAQMEHVKTQAYDYSADDDVMTYPKITPMPDGYTIWSSNRTGDTVNGADDDRIIAIPWDSESDEQAAVDSGLQKIKLIIKHEGETIFTLEGYKLDR